MKGKVIHLSTGGKSYTFPLAGATEAFDAVAACGKAIGAYAAGPTFGQVVVGTTENATRSDVSFPADAPKLVVQAQLSDDPPGTKVSALWIAEKTNAAPGDYHITTTSLTMDGRGHVAIFSLSKPNAGWPVGLYRVELSINDKPPMMVPFTVK